MKKIIELFEESVSDEIFGRSEKREIKQKLSNQNLSKREVDFLRSKIFDIAFAKINADNNLNILTWLENANKALNVRQKEIKEDAEVYFSPGKDCKVAILTEIGSALNNLDICVFTISDNEICRKIIERHKRGVKVRIISDNEKQHDRGSDIDELSRAGIEVKIDNTRHHMHHKFAVIDNEKVITGSYNWTRSAEVYNHENIIVLNDKKVTEAYKDEFKKLWKEMVDFV